MVDALGPSHEGEVAPEVISMQNVHKARLQMVGYKTGQPVEAELQGRTVPQLAAEVAANVYGIRTFEILEGTVMVDGKPEPVSGEKRNFSGMAYIDGRVMSLAEYNKRFPKDRQTKESQLRAHGRASDWLVELRTGGFLQFFPEQGDTSIPLQNRTDE